MINNNKVKSIYLFLFVIICGCDTSSKSQLMTFHGNEIIWKKNYLPVALIYGESCESSLNMISALEQSSASNDVFRKLFVFPMQWIKKELIVAARGTAFFHCVNEDEFDNDDTLAETSHNIEHDERTIGSVDVRIIEQNDYNLMFYIILHELGHVLGLSHDSNAKSIMYPYINGSVKYSNRTWEVEDMNILMELYCE